MVDDPYGDEGTETCRTLEDKCQDCRDINVNDIVTTHFTNCGKPFWCQGATGIERQYRLCLDLFREWHLVRLSLENEWINRYPTYRPRYAPTPDTKTIQGFYLNFSVSHCTKSGAYIKMTFPSVSEDELWISRGNNSELVLPNNEFEGGSRDLQRRNLSVQQTDTPPIQISSLTSAPGLIRPTAQISELIQVSASNANKTLVAYAVSVTSCDHSKSQILLDGAAVLHQSIRLTASQSKYAYRMVAFIHSDARECAPHFTKLGFDVQLRDTPFNETEIRNQALINVQGNSCCGSKEYIKLYSYLLKEYQIVVHMDLDTLVLKPMDDIFDLMLDPAFNRSRIDAMWLKPEEFPRQVDFLFTRDYNMVE